jgi:hypothetical protein
LLQCWRAKAVVDDQQCVGATRDFRETRDIDDFDQRIRWRLDENQARVAAHRSGPAGVVGGRDVADLHAETRDGFIQQHGGGAEHTSRTDDVIAGR